MFFFVLVKVKDIWVSALRCNNESRGFSILRGRVYVLNIIKRIVIVSSDREKNREEKSASAGRDDMLLVYYYLENRDAAKEASRVSFEQLLCNKCTREGCFSLVDIQRSVL